MENPIMIEWKYYQCTWTVVDNVDVIEYVPFWTYLWWICVGCLIWAILLTILLCFSDWEPIDNYRL